MKGATIKKRLVRTGTSQTELARLLGITPQAVAGILSAADVRTGTVERICDVLHLPLSYFYGEESEIFGNLGNIGGERSNGKRRTKDEDEKDREIEYLRGQVAAYENALSLLRPAPLTSPD